MHRSIFGHSFAVLVAPILVSVLAFNFLNDKKASARRKAEDDDAGASGLKTAPTVTNSAGSCSSPRETDDSASSSSLSEIDNSASGLLTASTEKVLLETDNGASSSLATTTGNCHEVFLSFRGPDTRDGFTDHLYNGLVKAGIVVFRDDNELPHGESIEPELTAAITKSKILIPILSVTYGTSSWCLKELVQMMEGKNKNGQIVLPIFYKVKPADVRHQKGSFGDAFHDWEGRLKERTSSDLMLLENWKKALAEVSDLKGYEAIGSEGKLVELIVRKVLSELKKKFELVICENLVGIDTHVKKVMEFVDNKSHDTLFISIHGMGGIGKTTLAKTIYNKLSSQFEHRSFIANISELWNHDRRHYLRKQLLKDILHREIEVDNEDEGVNFVSSRFKDKMVLVLLDDIDDVAQLNHLVGNGNWFSSGSKIIITTRDKRTLKNATVNYEYELRELDCDQSLILFSKYAFRKDSPPSEFEGLAREVVSTAGGLPLSLMVLGSLFCGKELEKWRGTIKKIEKVPPEEVQQKLKISFLALEDEQKQIFLDIACFFIGIDWRIASYMWEVCEFFPEDNIEVLRFMSLIQIGDDHKLRMHDQLRDLGRAIVREENKQHYWRRSRLWDPEQALDVLKGNKGKGTDKITAINLSKGNDDSYTEKQFKNLKRLRFLHLDGAYLHGDFENLMEELMWLRWLNCPINFEVQNFCVKKLAILELSWSAINENWKGWSFFKMAKELKFLDLSFSKSLKNTNFLSKFKNLEVLILNGCQTLQRIDSSIGDMKLLLRLELCWCTRLRELPAEIGRLKALKQLLLRGTEALSALPDSFGSLKKLEILDISESGIEELPNGIVRLTKLQELNAFDCRKLRGKKPESICNLSSLQRLDVRGCSNLQLLPDLPSNLTYLGVTCQSQELPSLSLLTHLKELRVSGCKSLECIGELPLTLSRNSGCSQLADVEESESELPRSLYTLFKLETLEVLNCESIKTLDVSQFIQLRTLSAKCCEKLLEVRGLEKLKYLESLTVRQCDSIKLLDLPKLEGLKLLDVCFCRNLVQR